MGIEEFLINRATEESIKKGIEQGIEKGIEIGIELQKRHTVTNLLQNTDFNSEKIAQFANVSLAFIEEVKKELGIK